MVNSARSFWRGEWELGRATIVWAIVVPLILIAVNNLAIAFYFVRLGIDLQAAMQLPVWQYVRYASLAYSMSYLLFFSVGYWRTSSSFRGLPLWAYAAKGFVAFAWVWQLSPQ